MGDTTDNIIRFLNECIEEIGNGIRDALRWLSKQ